MLRLAFDFIITWRETRTRPNAYQKRIYSLINKEVISVLCAISGRFVTWKKDYVTWLHSDIRRMSLPLLLLSSEERNVKTAL